MASAPSALPAEPGLRSQVAHHVEALRALVGRVDPDVLFGADARDLYSDGVAIKDLGVSLMARTAPKVAAANLWQDEGHRSPAEQLAVLAGVSVGEAKRTLATGAHLVAAPGVDAALREGRISAPKAALLAETVAEDPSRESELLTGAATETFQETKERCQAARAAMASEDPRAAERRIHAGRSFVHWSDADGFHFKGSHTKEWGAKLLARLDPVAERLRRERSTSTTTSTGSVGGSTTAPRLTSRALWADALTEVLFTGGDAGPGPDGGPEGGPDSGGRSTPGTTRTTSRGAPGRSRSPRALVVVQVDLEALRRRRAMPDELCAIDGVGRASIPAVESLLNDADVSLIFTRAGDVVKTSHHTRTVSEATRAALFLRDRSCCVVPHCTMRTGLEIDHVNPFALGGATALANLALLCRHHHHLKSYEGWTLTRHGPGDADPRWSFTPPPPFGQEPDLGLDRRDPDPDPPPGAHDPDRLDLGTDPPEPPLRT